jgi:hypothetical protein
MLTPTSKEFHVTIREDMGDHYEDNSFSLWGTDELDVRSYLIGIYGKETNSYFYIIQ